MDLNYFKTTKILDGGMGQELLAKGLVSKGTLWSTSAVLEEKYHQLLVDVHLSFINAGADVIVTNNFSSRRIRLIQNKVGEKFNYVNQKACELANKAREISKKNILIAGSLPPQDGTYVVDERDIDTIKRDFKDQAEILRPYVDFFYFDVLSSVREFKIGIECIKEFDKPYLIGAHISEGTKLPSGEKISEIITKIDHDKLLGIILSCISPENYELNLNEIKNLNVPFGFKLNGFVKTNPKPNYTGAYNKSKTGNPNEFLGQRKDLTPSKMAELAKKFKDAGATIIGGCCETRPAHIEAFSKLK